MSRSVGQQMARTLGLFQALVALPAMVILGELSMVSLFETKIPIYDFIAATMNAFFAAGIIFVVFVQRNVPMRRKTTVNFEKAKSGFATAIWVWMLIDTIVDPKHYWFYYGPNDEGHVNRIIRACISIIVLFIVYYPTLVFSIVEENSQRNDPLDAEAAGQETPGERQPLLRSQE